MRTRRPAMPEGYGVATGDEGTLPWSWVVEQCTNSRNYWICTTRPDGRPHAIPVWGLWLDDAIVFSTDPESLKARNFRDRPDVVVHLESGDDMVVKRDPVRRRLVDEGEQPRRDRLDRCA